MSYKFSTKTQIERYGVPMYAITNADGKVVAYSETKFKVPAEIEFLGNDPAFIFKGAKLIGGEINLFSKGPN